MQEQSNDRGLQHEVERLWLQNDENAAAALVWRSWGSALCRHAKRFHVSSEDAQEIVGMAIVLVLREHAGGKYSELRSCLFNAVRNSALNLRRYARRHPTISISEAVPDGASLIDDQDDPEAVCASVEEVRGLRLALAQLREADREVVCLHYLDPSPLPVKDIAAKLQKSERWVEKAITRSRKSLERALRRHRRRLH